MRWKLPGSRPTFTVAAIVALAASAGCGSDSFSSGGSGGSTGGTATGGTGTGGAGTGGTATGGTGGVTSGGAGPGGSGGTAATGGAAGAGGAVSSCGACDGCCVGGSCVPGGQQSWSQCGAHGDMCTSCAYGVRCEGGSCSDNLDQSARFNIVVDSVMVLSTDSSGGAWDINGGSPDPEVCFDDGQGRHGCTNYCDNQVSCSYSTADGTVEDTFGSPIAFDGSSLSNMTMVVFDVDTTLNDQIGALKVQIQKYAAQYTEPAFDRVVNVTFHLVPAP